MKKLAFYILTISAFTGLQAQTGGDPLVNDDDLVITSTFKGVLQDLDKPDMQPPVPDNPVETKNISYEKEEVTAKTEYEPPRPRVLKPEKEQVPPLYNNFLRVGFGRFLTPEVGLYLHNGRHDETDVGLEFNHLSSSNGYLDYTEYREDGGTLTGKYHLDEHTIGGRLHIYNTNYFYYADTIITDQPDLKDSIRQTFTKFEAEVSLAKRYKPGVITYDLPFVFRGFFDRRKNREVHATIRPALRWTMLPNLEGSVKSELTFSNAAFGGVDQSRFFLDITPSVLWHKDALSLEGGLKINSFTDSAGTFGVYPFAMARFDAVPEKLGFFGGFKGEMKYNTYYDMIAENRFIQRQADIMPGREKYNIYLGVDGNFAKYFSFTLKGYTKKVENQLVYFAPEGGAYFAMLYDTNFRQTGVQFSLAMNKEDKIRAGIRGDLRKFKMSNVTDNFAVPGAQLDFWASYNFADKLWVTSEVYFYGARTMTVDTAGVGITESPQADVNLHVDYRFSKRISLFLKLNNILGNEYFRWYNYQERPFYVGGGVTLGF